ncbi:MAG: FAD/NAD(P)-binding protein [Pseudomonadota bacterium]
MNSDTAVHLLPRPAVVEEVRSLTGCEKLFRLRPEDGVPLGHLPGQWVQVSIFGVGEAPISISSAPDGQAAFEICVRGVGNLTRGLHSLKAGERVGIRGPYGSHYPVEEARGKDLLCVAGGLGLAPLRSFIQYVLAHRADYGRLIVFYGARTPTDRLFADELHRWAADPAVEFLETVDMCAPGQTWSGRVGLITRLFPEVVLDAPNTYMTCVGPPVMYRFVVASATALGIPEGQIFMSLERRMRCGIGLCGHCQMDNVYVCQRGAVFRYADVKNIEEALS